MTKIWEFSSTTHRNRFGGQFDRANLRNQSNNRK